MWIEAGDIQTGAPMYRNFKEIIFELLDVASDQVTAILMLQKLRKIKVIETKYFKNCVITG